MTTTIFYVLPVIYAVVWNPLRAEGAADVTAPTGRVVGLELDVLGTTVHAFLGIPFAQPPVGERRFRRAEHIEPWDGIYNATRIPHSCMQEMSTDTWLEEDEFWIPKTPIGEDCLYLNVWRPSDVPTGAAVMVWIHGGTFNYGSSEHYDGRYLVATERVILVTMNYRLNTLGFLYAGVDDAPGNMGLTDQVLALKWVQDNIAFFGGDPNKVTLFGQSAGGYSIGYHMLYPESRGLFQRAILQSGPVVAQEARDSMSDAYEKTKSLAERLGCPTEEGAAAIVACLREQPEDSKRLIDAKNRHYPVVDGNVIPYWPSDALQNGTFKRADILLGVNSNEGMYFLVYFVPFYTTDTKSIINKEQFVALIKGSSLELNEFAVDATVFQYTDWTAMSKDTMYRDALDSVNGDVSFVCPTVATGLAHVQYGTTAYMYKFAHRASNTPWPDWMGVIHGAEIEFVFGWPLNATLGYTDEEVALSRRMMRHWANFARTGNPNNGNETTWSAFNQTDGGYMVLDTDVPRMLVGPRFTECAFWDKYVQPLTVKTDALLGSVESCESTTPITSDANGVSKAKQWLLNISMITMTSAHLFALSTI